MKKKTTKKESAKLPVNTREYIDEMLANHWECTMNFVKAAEERIKNESTSHVNGHLQILDGKIQKFKEIIAKVEQDSRELVSFFTKFTRESQGRIELQRQKIEGLMKCGPAIEELKAYAQALYEDLKDARKRLMIAEAKQEVLIQVIK